MNVSIVIPYYNRRELLVNSLNSIDKCHYPKEKYEIIIIEDGSNDFDEDSFKEYSQKIRYFRSDKKKLQRVHFPPRNIGVREATGEMVIFMDCDQIVYPDFITRHVEFHLKNGPNLLQFGCRKNLKKNQDLKNLENAEYDEDSRKQLFKDYSSYGQDMLGNWANVWSHNISVLKKHIEQFGGFDEGFTGWGLEDQEFGFRMKRGGLKVLHNPEIEVFHQYHTPAMGKSVYEGWMKNYEFFVRKYNGDLEVRAVRLLGEILNTSNDRRMKREMIPELSNLNYKRFELILRCLVLDKLEPDQKNVFRDKFEFYYS